MRFWLSGPRIGFFRPGLSFGSGYRRPPSRSYSRPRGDFIYVIESANNTVKIGYSSNPEARLATLQTGSGLPLSLNYVVACGDPGLVEQRAHEVLAKHRLQGEWFDCTPDAAVAAIHMAAHQVGVAVSPPDAPPSGRRRFLGPAFFYLVFPAIILIALYLMGHGH